MNTLLDHPRTPDAPEPLREPCLMDLDEMLTAYANYERKAHHDLIWHQDSFTPDERAHACAVAEQYGQWRDAVRWSYQRPD